MDILQKILQLEITEKDKKKLCRYLDNWKELNLFFRKNPEISQLTLLQLLKIEIDADITRELIVYRLITRINKTENKRQLLTLCDWLKANDKLPLRTRKLNGLPLCIQNLKEK